MEIEKFKEILEGCNRGLIYSGSQNLKIKVNPERTCFKIYKEPLNKICRCCGSDLSLNPQSITVYFKEFQSNLTIFQSSLLFNMFLTKKHLYDYARYHQCEAGKEFIENIKEVVV